MSEYGQLGSLVATAGSVMAAGVAILAVWAGKGRWAPPRNPLSDALEPVSVVVAMAIILTLLIDPFLIAGPGGLATAALAFGIAAVVALLVYLFLMIVLVHEKPTPTGDGTTTRTDRLIGGFWLTPAAKENLKQAGSVQLLLRGSAYDPDLLWSRPSRALATVSLAVCYMMLVVAGSVALASGAMLLDTKSPAKEARSQLAPESAQRSDASELSGTAGAAGRSWMGDVCLPPGQSCDADHRIHALRRASTLLVASLY